MSLITVEDIQNFHREYFDADPNWCDSVGDGWAIARMDGDRVALRPGGIINGPTVFSIAYMCLAFAVYTKIGVEPMAMTSELSIRYMRPAIGTELWARADIHHAGRRSVIGSVVIWTTDQAKPVAVAQGTYVRPVTTDSSG